MASHRAYLHAAMNGIALRKRTSATYALPWLLQRIFTFRPNDYACNKEYRFYAVAANDYASSAALAYGPPNSVIMPQCLRCGGAVPLRGLLSMLRPQNPFLGATGSKEVMAGLSSSALRPSLALQSSAAQPTLAA